jgi:hypothetical protein
MKLYIALLFLIAPAAQAAEVGLLVGSNHYLMSDSCPTCQGRNPGLFYKNQDYIYGYYHNSHKRKSVVVAKYKNFGNFTIAYGLVSGYRWDGRGYNKGRNVLPLISPSYNINKYIKLHMIGGAVAWSVWHTF